MNTHQPRSAAKFAAFVVLFAIFTSTVAQTGPPVARISDVTDEYFGTTVHDPYRWLENVTATETTDWIKGQADYARAYLDRLPRRSQILQELNGLSDAGAAVSDIRTRGELFFYAKRSPGEPFQKLYVRQGLVGAERVVVDPEKLSSASQHVSLYDWNVSLDGKYVSYILSADGTEVGELRVVETATGKDLGERIDRTRYGSGEWLPDGKSFLYPRFPKLPAGAPETDLYLKNRLYRHVLGTDPDTDKPVFGYGVNPEMVIDEATFPTARTFAGGKYVFAYTATTLPNIELYVAPVDTLDRAVVPWRKIAGLDDEVTAFDLHGNDLFLQTFKGTPRYQIVVTSLTKPDVAHAATMFAGGRAVVEALAAQRDALYVQALDGGNRTIYRIDYRTKKAEPLKLPYAGSSSIAFNVANRDGIYLTIDSWTRSSAHFKYDPKTDRVADTKIIPPVPIDMHDIEVVNTQARSYDGTMIPLVMLYKKGLPRDGSNPTLVRGYGAYGFEDTSPTFVSSLLPWFNRGGLVVYAGVRGGGEYGEEWHRGGFKQTKPNTWKDFIACAEYLIQEKYTSPAFLAGQSYSAGGILIGRAITERPDLFAAAIINVGDTNALRSETATDGEANSDEYGTSKIEAEFRSLFEMDAYQHVSAGTKYPAVLLVHGFNDARVPVWESAKMAARLQADTVSGKPVLLRIDYNAGHGGIGITQNQRNETQADTMAFLLEQLGARR